EGKGPGHGLGADDSRAPRPARWAARHQGRRGEAADADARGVGRGEGGSAGRRLLGQGREGDEVPQVREVARLRGRVAHGPAPLLRAVGPRHMKLGLSIGYSGAELKLPVDKILLAERLGFDSVSTAEACGSAAMWPAASLCA